MSKIHCILSAVVIAALSQTEAAVKVPGIFSDHMVIQRNKALPVWGTAEPGEKVTVSFAGQTKMVQTGGDGKWLLRLDPLTTNANPQILKITGSNEITLQDVLVGEVWLASGQSNMEMPVGNIDPPNTTHRKYPGVQNAAEELKNANYPLLRLCKVERVFAQRPIPNVPTAGWKTCSPDSAYAFSAVGYFYGRHLVENLKVPVGIIQCALGNSQAEQWTSIEALAKFPQFADVAKFYLNTDFSKLPYPEYEKIAPKGKPSFLFNGGISPLIPYAIQGAIWYQGESNADRSEEYRQLIANMIADWRQRWGQGDFPFLFVQLAGYGGIPQTPREHTWAEMRESQTMMLNIPNTGMATAIDIGMVDFIHPLNKQEVGRRLGLVAQSKVYGVALESSGPVFKSMKIDGSKAVIQFDHLGGGLISRDPSGNKKVSYFAVAGADRSWKWADARIVGDAVELSCAAVKDPVAVRYAWAGNIACDFFSKTGLPVLPFRTDNWPLTTAGKIYEPGDAFRNALNPPKPTPVP